jgi:hypothetical protein
MPKARKTECSSTSHLRHCEDGSPSRMPATAGILTKCARRAEMALSGSSHQDCMATGIRRPALTYAEAQRALQMLPARLCRWPSTNLNSTRGRSRHHPQSAQDVWR